MKRIYIMGDIHGDYKPIRDLYSFLNSYYNKDMRPDNTDTLILLGDVGANFSFDWHDTAFKKKLSKYKFTYFCIRGNHEARVTDAVACNPQSWHTEQYFGGNVWVENEYPYIKYANDEIAVYNILGCNTLIIPGAYSVDKYYRLLRGWTWFENEQLTQEEMDRGDKCIKDYNNKFDLVFSHTCPFSYEPTDLFLSTIDQSTVDTTMERYLERIERQIDYKLWCFGHFHAYRVYPTDKAKQMVMLFNQEIIDLTKYWETRNILSSTINLHQNIEI